MRKILVIDDEKEFCSLIKDILEITGEYEVVYATDGKHGIKIATEQKPDLILLDIMMPTMDGFEVLKVLKEDERSESIPTIFVTALDKIEEKVKGFRMGVVDYITKPISIDEVKARIRAHLSVKFAEEERVRAKELMAIKDLIVTYNHEMKQPLTVILGNLKMLMDEVDEDDERYPTLEIIEEQTNKLVAILDKIGSIDSI